MALPPTPKRIWAAVAAIVIVALALAASAPTPSVASSVLSARQQVGVSEAAVFEARQKRTRLELERRRVDARRKQLWRQVGARLDAIYRSGAANGLEAALSRGGSVGDALDAASTVNTVARHDRRQIDRYVELTRRSDRLEREMSQAEADITKAERALDRSIHRLEVARREQAGARKRAAKLARLAESPLRSPALAPETVSVEQAADNPEPPASAPGYSETGLASMYAASFAGKPTASGEPYDPGAMTAAHRTLPLGTWVHVKGPGGSAMVRINDRGPFVGGRILDLSEAAAGAVGLGGLGTVTITVQQ